MITTQWNPEPRRVAEDIAMLPGETLSGFTEALMDAIRELVELPEGTQCYVREVTSDWFVMCCVPRGEPAEVEHYRVAYSRGADGAFEFTSIEPVEEVVSWVPEKEAAEATADVPCVAGAGKRKVKPKMVRRAAAAEPASRTEQRELRRFTERHDVGLRAIPVPDMVERAALATLRSTPLPEAAPNGRRFIGLLVGEGAVAGRMNRNRRIYAPTEMAANAERLAERIARAYARQGEGPNHDLVFGETDHPPDGSRIWGSSTVLLAASYSEETGRVQVAFGVMNTTAGRDLMEYAAVGGPVGVSTRCVGLAETRTMGPEDPHWRLNAEHAGTEYEHVYQFTLEAFDAVTDPSASVWADKVRALEAARQSAPRPSDAPLGEAAQAGDEALPISQPTEDAMDEKKVAELIEAARKSATEEAAKATTDALKGRDEQIAALTEKAGKAEAALAEAIDKLAKAGATLAALDEAVKTLRAERDAAKAAAELGAEIEAQCAGSELSEMRRKFVAKRLEGAAPADVKAAVKAASEEFDSDKSLWARALGEQAAPGGRKVAEGSEQQGQANGKPSALGLGFALS